MGGGGGTLNLERIFFIIKFFQELLSLFIQIIVMMFNSMTYYQIVILYSIDVSNIITLLILLNLNKKKYRLLKLSKNLLSEQYQIAENIRILKLLFPLLLTGLLANITASTTAFVQIIFFSSKNLFQTGYYYLVIDSFPIITLAIILTTDQSARKRLQNLKFLFKREEHAKSIANIQQQTQTHFFIKNVVGQELAIKDSVEIHFQQLTNMWK